MAFARAGRDGCAAALRGLRGRVRSTAVRTLAAVRTGAARALGGAGRDRCPAPRCGPVDTGVDAGRTALTSADPGRPGRVRVRSLAARAAAVLLAAVAALLALPLPAQAQTTTFVSNLGQTDSSSNAFSAISTPRAQQFETGSNSGGYTLTEIVVNIRGARTGIPAFALYTSTTDDKPGTKVVDLSGNSSTAGEQSFTPASATTLSASTEYFIVFVVDSGEANLQRTASNDIDSGASTGWDIAENSLFSTDSGANWTSSGSSVEIAIKGTAVGGTDNTVPGLDSATVDGTALVLTYDEALDTGSVPGSTATR